MVSHLLLHSFLNLDENNEYIEENAMIVEEILRQRLEGIKNEKGVYVTPAFPKLIYVLDENNCLKGGKYDYITKLAVKCSAKRMYPDYISAKKMRENYEGNVSAVWDAEVSCHLGRMRTATISLKVDLIRVLSALICRRSVFWRKGMKKYSGN